MNSTKDENMEQEKVSNEEMEQNKSVEDIQQEETQKEELSNEEKLQQNLKEAENKIKELQDRYLRLSAEFDNFRKRTNKEKAEIIKNGAEKTILAILPILDDMERAISNMHKSNDADALREGVELINNKFLKTLSKEGLSKIETENADFNTDYHEAIAMLPAADEQQKGKIIDCVQTGYLLNDKVIRHAKVAVAQ